MAELEFQDFHTQRVTDVEYSRNSDGITYEFKHLDDSSDRQDLLGNSKELPTKNVWSFEYYQQFFDVDTEQVYDRLLNSMIPRIKSNFIAHHIRPIPDLYGPFWICMTLIFTTAICGNLTKYIETAGGAHFQSDFGIVTASATVIFAYVILVPFALYSIFWYRNCDVQYTYVEMVCAYGYSLSIFIPVSILWVIHIDSIRWALIGIAVLMSGCVLVFSFWSVVRSERKLIAFSIIFGIVSLHALLAIGFKEYFFDTSITADAATFPPINLSNPSLPIEAIVPSTKAIRSSDSQTISSSNDKVNAPTMTKTVLPSPASSNNATNVT